MAKAIKVKNIWKGMSQAKLKTHIFKKFADSLIDMAPVVKAVFSMKNINADKKITPIFFGDRKLLPDRSNQNSNIMLAAAMDIRYWPALKKCL